MLEISTLKAFEDWLGLASCTPAALQDLPLTPYAAQIRQRDFCGSLFLGCELTPDCVAHIVTSGGVVIPDHDRFTFPAHRAALYSPHEIFDGFDPGHDPSYSQTYDARVYREYLDQGIDEPTIDVTLHRSLHDHSITEALHRLSKDRKVVAIMGGHSMERRDPFYRAIADISRTLTRKGFLMATGGGPGAMEAAHLGAYLAARDDAALDEALEILRPRPEGAKAGKEYLDVDWLARAWHVREAFPLNVRDFDACVSVGIPTWFYGHEPPAAFPTHIAKYFANSIREDGLLMMARQGIIFSPGSAGTTQEIFQDAAQNHYSTAGHPSPMILFGEKHWTKTRPVWPLLKKVSEGEPYGNLVHLTDDAGTVIDIISRFDPDDLP